MTAPAAGHTPTPWRFEKDRQQNCLCITGPNGERTTTILILDHEPEVGIFGDPDGAKADAEFICRAVNSYVDLLKALETAIRVAAEARKEWDAAPNGMKAGKLLIALSDPSLNYRADITEMHRPLASAQSSSKGERM